MPHLVLEYSANVPDEPDFDLVLPLDPDPLRLHFRKERTTFLESWL